VSLKTGEWWPRGTLFVRGFAGFCRRFETFVGVGTWVLGRRSHGCPVVIMKNDVKERTVDM
jgi:hypothetical protein